MCKSGWTLISNSRQKLPFCVDCIVCLCLNILSNIDNCWSLSVHICIYTTLVFPSWCAHGLRHFSADRHVHHSLVALLFWIQGVLTYVNGWLYCYCRVRAQIYKMFFVHSCFEPRCSNSCKKKTYGMKLIVVDGYYYSALTWNKESRCVN